jgi:hypothetical protein
MYKYNIHTNATDLGASVSVAEIDGLERIETAEGRLSLSGANVVDVGEFDADKVVSRSIKADRASITDLTSTTGDIEILNAGSLGVRGDVDVTGALRAAGNVQISGLATIAEATIASLHTTMTDCVRLIAVNLSAAIAGFAQVTATAGDVETLNAGSLGVRGDVDVTGSLRAGNIICTVLTVVADAQGFYVWTHAVLKPPVFHIAIPEGGEQLRLMNTDETSAVFYFTLMPL